MKTDQKSHAHTHTRLTALIPGQRRWAGTRKAKPVWILLKQETVSGSGISWAIYKSAPCSRQITMPAPHHSVFYRLDVLPAAQPTQFHPKAINRTAVSFMDGKRYTTNTHVFLNLKFLESYELGATSLQIQSTTRLVSDTVLTGTRQQRHELRRGDLQQTSSQRVLTTNCTAEGGGRGRRPFILCRDLKMALFQSSYSSHGVRLCDRL